MIVCVCVYKAGLGGGGGLLLAKAYMHVRTDMHMCECAYVHMSQSAYYTWLVLCSILHDLQSYVPSSRSFFMRETEFGKSRLLGSQGHHGELATARCCV